MDSHVIQQFVASIEWPVLARTVEPIASIVILTVSLLVDVTVLDV